jgi:hypothetical protein
MSRPLSINDITFLQAKKTAYWRRWVECLRLATFHFKAARTYDFAEAILYKIQHKF